MRVTPFSATNSRSAARPVAGQAPGYRPRSAPGVSLAPLARHPGPAAGGLLPAAGLVGGAGCAPLDVMAGFPDILAAIPGPVTRNPDDTLDRRGRRRDRLDARG